MKKFKLPLIALVGLLSLASVFAFKAEKKETKTKFLLVTTIESVVPGGLGRSRMIMSDKDGKMQETKMENFYSMVGINFGNINENNKEITRKIEDLTNQGWTIFNVSTGVQSGTEGGNATGLFITRYMFKREE